MPYTKTLAQARNRGPLKTVAGVCSNTEDFVDLINEAGAALASGQLVGFKLAHAVVHP